MARFYVILLLICVIPTMARGQKYHVYKDAHGQLVTTFTWINSYSGSVSVPMPTSGKAIVVLGSPYLTFPTWHKGIVEVDTSGKKITGDLAFNLVTSDIMFRLDSTTKAYNIAPYTFVIDGLEFTRQRNNLLGIDYQVYTTVLHDGETKLLKSWAGELISVNIPNPHERDSKFDGYYKVAERYYIRRGYAPPELIDLTKKSVLSVLYGQAEKLSSKLPSNKLTVNDITKALACYDSLMTVDRIGKPPLSFDPVFDQFLHTHITYPGMAWVDYAYGRFYVSFDIADSGLIENIAMLSSNKYNYGFSESIIKALKKLYKMNPVYAGHYVLPVAFTFTNTKDKTGTYKPRYKLPADRFSGRTVLEEITVPVEVVKPVSTTWEIRDRNL